MSKKYSLTPTDTCDTMEILNNIRISLDMQEIKKKLHMEDREDSSHIQALIKEVQPLIRAKAVYRDCYLESKSEDAIVVAGIRFTSRVLRRQMENVGRVFPFVVTIGSRIEEHASACKDFLKQYYLDTIGNTALITVRKYLEDHLRSKYALGCISYMSPGSLKDWDLKGQRPLFSILGDVQASIGVYLTEALLMIPAKSLSGIFFPTEIPFHSCQLCPRENCQSRKAKYNEKLAIEYGIQAVTNN
jgi:hypothetical protein